MPPRRAEPLRLVIPRPLRDAIQRCEVHCVVGCCGTSALDPSPSHLAPWVAEHGPAVLITALDQLEAILVQFGDRRRAVACDEENGFNAVWDSGRLCREYLLGVWQPALLGTYTQTVARSDDPAWRTWNREAVIGLARTIHRERSAALLPILADALEEAGCDEAYLLAHCRRPEPHAARCWVIDRLLGSGATGPT